MGRSAIYTINTNTQALAVGSVIDLGSVVRRFGQNISLNNNYLNVRGEGYYHVSAAITITGTTAGTTSIDMIRDGVVIASAPVTVAVGAVVTIPLQTLIREYGCNCANNSNISFAISGTAETVNSISVIVEKV